MVSPDGPVRSFIVPMPTVRQILYKPEHANGYIFPPPACASITDALQQFTAVRGIASVTQLPSMPKVRCSFPQASKLLLLHIACDAVSTISGTRGRKVACIPETGVMIDWAVGAGFVRLLGGSLEVT